MDREKLMTRRAELMAQLAANTVELERAEEHLEHGTHLRARVDRALAAELESAAEPAAV